MSRSKHSKDSEFHSAFFPLSKSKHHVGQIGVAKLLWCSVMSLLMNVLVIRHTSCGSSNGNQRHEVIILRAVVAPIEEAVQDTCAP